MPFPPIGTLTQVLAKIRRIKAEKRACRGNTLLWFLQNGLDNR